MASLKLPVNRRCFVEQPSLAREHAPGRLCVFPRSGAQ